MNQPKPASTIFTNLEGKPPTEKERAENSKKLAKLHRGNRLRLMLGKSLFKENDK